MKDLKSIELPEPIAYVVGNSAKPPFALRKTLPTGWGYSEALFPESVVRAAIGSVPAELARLRQAAELARKAQLLYTACWDLADGSGCFISIDSMKRFDEVFEGLGFALGDLVHVDEEEERELFEKPFARAERAEAQAQHFKAALERIAAQGPNHGPDGTMKSWQHWAEIARQALDSEPGESKSGLEDADAPAEAAPLKGQGALQRQSSVDIPAPFQSGDWVAEAPESGCPDIAKVKDVYWDDIANEWVADLVLYAPSGNRLGRRSPAMGGPRGFEPCVPVGDWRKIEKPQFPVSTDMSGHRNWAPYLQYLDGAHVDTRNDEGLTDKVVANAIEATE